jgi:glycosyltransferase involved in cell wall biosynthesis
LAECLNSIGLSLPGINFEVIVSDDGNDTETKYMIQNYYPWVTYIEGPRKGPAANRNSGAKVAKGNWLVFTDDDCLPSPVWLKEYANAIKKNPESKAFEGAIIPDDWDLLKKELTECPVNVTGSLFWSANIMVEKNLFNLVGGFNELFKYAAHEDQFLYTTIKKYTQVIFVPESIVIHPVRKIGLLEKVIVSGKKRSAWIQLNILENKTLSQIMALAFSNSIRYLVASLKKGHAKEFVFHAIGLIFGIPSIPFSYWKLIGKPTYLRFLTTISKK